jgi:hypothetical protein
LGGSEGRGGGEGEAEADGVSVEVGSAVPERDFNFSAVEFDVDDVV